MDVSEPCFRYQVELSTDLDFTGDLIVDRLSNNSTNQPITDTFAPVTARYAKLTVTGASGYSGSWVSLMSSPWKEVLPLGTGWLAPRPMRTRLWTKLFGGTLASAVS